MADKKFIYNLKNNADFADKVKVLYGEDKLDYQAERYRKIYDMHTAKYGEGGVFYSSPGRIEVCGNHTDHNNGKVVCASINVDTIACVTPCEGKVVINSVGFSPIEVDLNDLDKKEEEYGKSVALVRGILSYFKQRCFNYGGFCATTTSDVFRGAGVSSSACFEVLICEILNVMYNEGKVDIVAKAKASQYAENVYFGKPCGLLDQCAISFGGVSYIDFKSIRKLKFNSVDWGFDDLSIVLTNTGGDHADLTDQYAAIRGEMEEVASLFGAKKLREVEEKEFYSKIPEIQKKTSGRAILRAMHFYSENRRVDSCAKAVKYQYRTKFINVINESGLSSYLTLQNCYPLGDVAQRIPLAINLSKRIDGVKAVRVHGGGFAGTIIAYVEKSKCENYVEKMREVFGKENVFPISVRNVGACKVFD